MSYTIKRQIRSGLPQVGVPPYRQIHAHSTGNPDSTAQNEADYMSHKNIALGYYTHVVGNGQVIQVAEVNRGSYDVGGDWNAETYASVEIIESHKTQAEFDRDYKIYIELIRDLAKAGNIPYTLNSAPLAGVKTHNFCRLNQPNNKTDHTDPDKYLAKWGISIAQFRKDIENGISSTTAPVKPNPTPAPAKKVEILPHATAYSKSSKGAKIASWVKEQKTFTYSQERAITQGYSNKEYLITNKGVALGWVLSQDVKGGYGSDKVGKPAPVAPKPPVATTGKWIAERGKFIVGEANKASGVPDVKVNSLPLTVNATGKGALIANITKGQSLVYDAFMNDGKYLWIRQPRGNGYGYMATGDVKNGKRVNFWGKFTDA